MMAPPWVKGPREPTANTSTVVRNTPWANAPGPLATEIALPSTTPNSKIPVRIALNPSRELSNISVIQRSNPVMPITPTSPLLIAQKNSQSPKSLSALLQQAPLPALSPVVNEDSLPGYGTCGNTIAKPPAPTTPRTPATPAGPLVGAKFVLPPLPPSAPLKGVTRKSPAQQAKIAKLRQLIPQRPDIKLLLSEIENGMKLNHVSCNDRSKPLIGPCQTFFPTFERV